MTRTRSQPVNGACNRIFERGGEKLYRVFREPALNFRSIFIDRFEIIFLPENSRQNSTQEDLTFNHKQLSFKKY